MILGGDSMRWNKKETKYAYERCIQEFESYGFSVDDIERLGRDQLSAKEFKTSSDRIERMIVTAYYVGKLKGIRDSDGAFMMIEASKK